MDTRRHFLVGFCAVLLFVAAGWALLSAPPVNAQGGCTEKITDGGFEAGDAWQLGTTPLMPEYVTYTKHGGEKSLVLGITRGGGKMGYSSAKQMVTLLPGATKVTLSFWFNAMVEGIARPNAMQMILLNSDGSTLATPWKSSNDSRVWNQMTVDLTRWRGHTVQIYFNVYNDGTSNTAGMFLDDVSLVVCGPTPSPAPSRTPTPTGGVTPVYPTQPPTRTATPSPSATPTATPTSPNCGEILQNGGFETGLSPWEAEPVVIPVQTVTTPVRNGVWALRLGTQTGSVASQSPVRQIVAIPPASQTATLRFYLWTWAENPDGVDRQEAQLFAADGSRLRTLWFELSNNPTWRAFEADLSPYVGQTVQLIFNVYNDGLNGRAAMFLDDVSLVVCQRSPSGGGPNPPLAPAVRAMIGPALLWPDLSRGPAAGPQLARSLGIAPTGASTSAIGPRTTRVAIALTPAPSATMGAARSPEITAAPTKTTRPALAVPSEWIETWQKRWWVIVIALALLAVLALLKN
ncbi:MAG: hypothetical protein NT169_04315 [Chloroflexi bacterium]|nr:hypothetical protein [Chloroflexota bacterium]